MCGGAQCKACVEVHSARHVWRCTWFAAASECSSHWHHSAHNCSRLEAQPIISGCGESSEQDLKRILLLARDAYSPATLVKHLNHLSRVEPDTHTHTHQVLS